MQVTSKTLV